MDVISVGNISLTCPPLKNTSEFTLERNPMDVISVDNTSLEWTVLKATRKSIPERNHKDVIIHISKSVQ